MLSSSSINSIPSTIRLPGDDSQAPRLPRVKKVWSTVPPVTAAAGGLMTTVGILVEASLALATSVSLWATTACSTAVLGQLACLSVQD